MTSSDRLVECAKYFHHTEFEARDIPESFQSDEEALNFMKNSLLFEAHQSMQESSKDPPENVLFNAIDLATTAPGIVSTKNGEVITVRSDSEIREVPYELLQHITTVDESITTKPISKRRVEKMCENAEKKMRKAHEKEEHKAMVALMNKDEKKEYNRLRREEREARKEQKKAIAPNGGEDDVAAPSAPTPETDLSKDANDDASPEENDDAIDEKEIKKVDTVAERSVVDAMSRMPSTRRRKPTTHPDESVPVYYDSPAPFDRHLTALMTSSLHPSLSSTILMGTPSKNPGLRLVIGPPGCGKTTRLVDDIVEYHTAHPDVRILVCGLTNLAVADLYVRCFRKQIVGCLALSDVHIPPGIPKPRNVDLHTSKIVFSTISGRTAPRLIYEAFGAVFLDEASLCSEALVWGLLRADVAHVEMVGDPKQLSAQVSQEGKRVNHDRSMFQRLLSLNVDAERLTVQHRMHEEICSYPSRAFYDGQLVTSAERQSVSAWSTSPYAIVQVAGATATVGTSLENEVESAACLEEARRLQKEHADAKIVVLTPYAAQVRRFRSKQSGIECATIDAYQGKEADIVILSLVRDPSMGDGFWSRERLNVALTRARHVMRVVGHRDWKLQKDSEVGELFRDADERGLLVTP